MKKINYPLATYVKHTSPLVFGCMGLGGGWNNNNITKQDISQAHEVIDTSLSCGITVFDHADIYTFGKAEKVFGEVLKQRPDLRDQITLQSKCGIRFEDSTSPKRYDFSKEWIHHSVEGILQRLNIEQLDILMLHRPDPLMEPEEIAEAFDTLHQQGKVKHFGVSNMQVHQLEFLQSSLSAPLVCNQLELSLSSLNWLEQEVSGGCTGFKPLNFTGGTIEYCSKNKVQLQAWGCLSQGVFSGVSTKNKAEHIQKTSQLVSSLAKKYEVSNEAIVLAWLLKHPAHIQPVIGTTNVERIKACAQATTVTLSRDDWYSLFVSARGDELP